MPLYLIRFGAVTVAVWMVLLTFQTTTLAQSTPKWGGIRVVDEVTGRGVPLVELESTHSVRWISDNTGCIYIDDADLLDQNVFFYVHGHGYEVEKDGFGFAGARLDIKRGTIVELKVKRSVAAERLVRLTGIGQTRDSALLGFDHSKYLVPLNGQVVGQDSIQAVPWNGKVLCIWGDTSKAGYPLGLFRAAGALAPLTQSANEPFDPSLGIPYQYFVHQDFVRAMMPLPERKEGVIWLDGLATVKDDQKREHVVAHYSRRAGLADELEHGIAILDPDKMEFKVLYQIQSLKEYRHPHGHAQIVQADGIEWAVFGNPFPNVRVPATLAAIQDPEQYEALTPLDSSAGNYEGWGWKKSVQPFTSKDEGNWLDKRADVGRTPHFLPYNSQNGKDRVIFHNGSFAWNEYRKKWIVLGGRWNGKDSLLGEVWFTESDSLEGPYDKAVKVATHVQQSFYNVCHHSFWDQNHGKVVFFEGTFTADFSGNPYKTPRYNYNQVLYRLDLEKLLLQ
jgi:hypothetical protein